MLPSLKEIIKKIFVKHLIEVKILALSKFKALVDNNFIVAQMVQFLFEKGGKHCGERRKCWLPAFSPFTHIVFKRLFPQGHQKR